MQFWFDSAPTVALWITDMHVLWKWCLLTGYISAKRLKRLLEKRWRLLKITTPKIKECLPKISSISRILHNKFFSTMFIYSVHPQIEYIYFFKINQYTQIFWYNITCLSFIEIHAYFTQYWSKKMFKILVKNFMTPHPQ